MSASSERQEERLGGLAIRPGEVLLKKYRVERLIGEGGTGIVLSATHVQLEQRVAIKFLKPALASDELRARFEREARAMEKIESEHVVLVLDTGTLEDGAPFMVMEQLEGRDLAQVLKEDGPLPVERAVDCMMQVCEALERAHAAGVVHRDLKPANLFLTERDGAAHMKVVDFGISKVLAHAFTGTAPPPNPFEESTDGSGEMTGSFTMLGSPRYMAPEQMRNSKAVDARADLWSVGAVLFLLLTGKHAFEGETNAQACVAATTKEPRWLRAFAPHVPEALEPVVRRCLAKDVNQRFQNAAELAAALRPFASTQGRHSLEHAKQSPSVQLEIDISQRSRAATGSHAPARSSTDPVSVTSPGMPAPRARWSLVGLGLGTFVLVLSGLFGIRRIAAHPSPVTARLATESVEAPAAPPKPSASAPLDAGKKAP